MTSFVFLDHVGPTSGGMDLGPHLHVGLLLCTLTYVYEGNALHRDSTEAERAVVLDVRWTRSDTLGAELRGHRNAWIAALGSSAH